LAKKPVKNENKVKCPLCGFKFIPTFFHIDKVNYKFENQNHIINIHFFKSSNNNGKQIRPLQVIRKTWVTSCPSCSYILRFAAEMGKKELIETYKYPIEGNLKRVLHKSEFKERDQAYRYNFYTIDKPFRDSLNYSKELNEETQNKIESSLEELNLSIWGNIYKAWKLENQMDSFKFLIRFFSNFEKLNENFANETNEQEITPKIDALNLPESLKKLLLKAYALRNKTINDNYELTENDEIMIQGVFIKLVLELVLQRLKPLKLNNVNLQSNYDGFDENYFYLELTDFLHKYLQNILGIKNFEEEFFNPLLKSLKIPINT